MRAFAVLTTCALLLTCLTGGPVEVRDDAWVDPTQAVAREFTADGASPIVRGVLPAFDPSAVEAGVGLPHAALLLAPPTRAELLPSPGLTSRRAHPPQGPPHRA